MAIIQGVTPATVSQVTPYKEDIDKLAAGITARENRGAEVRNSIAKTQAELIAETRDHDEDWGLAKELQDEYRNEVQSLVDSAEMDYSNVSRDQLQALATKYAGDNRFRALSSWKKNSDEFVAAKQKLEAAGKIPLIFGSVDPTKDNLRDENGNFKHATNKWMIEEELDAPKAAQELFDNRLGNTLKETLNWNKSKGNWLTFWKKWWESNSDNHTQVNEVIDNALNHFIDKTPEGNQYYRKLMRDLKTAGVDDESADKRARSRIQDLITMTGESLKKDQHKVQSSVQSFNDNEPLPPRVSGKKGGGSGGDVKPPSNPVRNKPSDYSVDGLNINNSHNALEAEQDIISQDYDKKSLTTIDNVSQLNNIHAVAQKMTDVVNPFTEGDNNTVYIQDQGTLQSLDLSLDSGRRPHENRSVLALNNQKDDDTKYVTTESNYRKLKEDLSVDEIKELGDEYLFTREDYIKASQNTNNPYASNNEKNVINHEEGTSHAISTLSVNYENTPGNFISKVGVNPVLKTMLSTYEDKALKFKNEMNKALDSNDKQLVEENKRLYKLYTAKADRMSEKIDEVGNFMDDHKDEISEMNTYQIRLMNHHKELYEVNKFIFRKNNLDYDNYLEAQKPENANNPKYSELRNMKFIYNQAKKEALEKSMYDVGMGNVVSGVFKEANGYKTGDKESDKKIDKITDVYVQFLNRIRKGKITESDIRKIPGYENRDISDVNQQNLFNAVLQNELFKNGLLDDLHIVDNTAGTVSGKTEKTTHDFILNLKKKAVYSQGFMEYNPESRRIDFKAAVEDPLTIYEKSYNNTMSSVFKGKNNDWLKAFNEIEQMDDVFTIPNRLMISGKDAAGNDNIKAALTDMMWDSFMSKGSSGEIRRLIYGEGKEGKVIKEEFNRQELHDMLDAAWTQTDQKGDIIDFKKNLLSNMISGIMFDDTNEDTENILVFSPDGKNRLEMNVTLSRGDLLDVYGVSGFELSMNDELRTGLRENNGHYFDLSGFGGRPGMRVFRALYSDPSNKITKGSYYVLSKTGDMTDPDVGSAKYNLGGGFKPIVFNSKFDLFEAHKNRYNLGTANALIEKLSLLKRGYNPNIIFSETGPEAPFRNMTREQAMTELSNMIRQEAGGGNFQTASDGALSDYTTAGVVRTQTYTDSKGNKSSKINISPDVFTQMSNDDKKNLALVIKPTLKNINWTKDKNGEDYATNPEKLEELPSKNLTAFHTPSNRVKMKFGNEVAGLIKDINSIVSLLRDKNNNNRYKDVANTHGFKLNDLTKINPMELITIPSGLRSLQDNLRAYNANGVGNLNRLTNSNHMRGNAIDIRTEPGSNLNDPNRHWKGGKSLWEFFKTPSGQSLLKKHKLRAYYHKIEGDQYHIDISTASDRHPAGKVFDDLGNIYSKQ